MKPFDNVNRNRYYGLRVGDVVKCDAYDIPEAVVYDYGFMDNNRVHLKLPNGEIQDVVAEWCQIITKVEDKHE